MHGVAVGHVGVLAKKPVHGPNFCSTLNNLKDYKLGSFFIDMKYFRNTVQCKHVVNMSSIRLTDS